MLIQTPLPKKLAFICFDHPRAAGLWLNEADNLDRLVSIVKHHGKTIINYRLP